MPSMFLTQGMKKKKWKKIEVVAVVIIFTSRPTVMKQFEMLPCRWEEMSEIKLLNSSCWCSSLVSTENFDY